MCFSDEGLSLCAEGQADATTPLSLDSALQERLQQERASMQSEMEQLEKKKNEEIQNIKTSLIAEQQVCNFATNVLVIVKCPKVVYAHSCNNDFLSWQITSKLFTINGQVS